MIRVCLGNRRHILTLNLLSNALAGSWDRLMGQRFPLRIGDRFQPTRVVRQAERILSTDAYWSARLDMASK